MEIDNINAPKIPPSKDDVKAALRALAAMPFFESGNPSITVACEPAVPGTPIKTAGNVSEVVVGASTPIIMARACEGSKVNTKGSTSAKPDVPPIPGSIPTTKPSNVPAKRKAK